MKKSIFSVEFFLLSLRNQRHLAQLSVYSTLKSYRNSCWNEIPIDTHVDHIENIKTAYTVLDFKTSVMDALLYVKKVGMFP